MSTLTEILAKKTTDLVTYADLDEVIRAVQAAPSPCSCLGYKRYIATLNQLGGSNISATIHVNEIGNITWRRISTGQFVGTITGGIFPYRKTGFFGLMDQGSAVSNDYPQWGIIRISDTTVLLGTSRVINGAVFERIWTDDILLDQCLEIRVFP